jgi:hypothetical protein
MALAVPRKEPERDRALAPEGVLNKESAEC